MAFLRLIYHSTPKGLGGGATGFLKINDRIVNGRGTIETPVIDTVIKRKYRTVISIDF
jgi:hypothetical protein